MSICNIGGAILFKKEKQKNKNSVQAVINNMTSSAKVSRNSISVE